MNIKDLIDFKEPGLPKHLPPDLCQTLYKGACAIFAGSPGLGASVCVSQAWQLMVETTKAFKNLAEQYEKERK